MSVELVIAGYVRIAKQDLDGARVLNSAANRNAAYLCEQAAEKLIRAVLTSEGIHAGVRRSGAHRDLESFRDRPLDARHACWQAGSDSLSDTASRHLGARVGAIWERITSRSG